MASRKRHIYNWWQCEALSLYVPSLCTRALRLSDIAPGWNRADKSQNYASVVAPLVQDRDHSTKINDRTTIALGAIEEAKEEFAPNDKPI